MKARPTCPLPRHVALAHAIYGQAEFNNAATRRRVMLIAADKMARPARSITASCPSDARAKAAYRLISNYKLSAAQKTEERVTPEQLWEPVFAHSIEQSRDLPVVYVVQDTTCLMYPTLAATEGLGTAERAKEEALWMHTAMGVCPDGHVVGLYDVHIWARPLGKFGRAAKRNDRPFEDKESHVWVSGAHATANRFAQHDIQSELIFVNDRGSDVHEVLQDYVDKHQRFVVRVAQDRRIQEPRDRVRAHLAAQAIVDRRTITVPRARGQREREARVELRSASVTLDPPRRAGAHRKPCHINVMQLTEVEPPEGVAGIEWVLYTSEPVGTIDECWAVVAIYKLRWRIEDYHRVLKSECHAEKTQLKKARSIERLLAILGIAAVRILQLRDLARCNPNALCTLVLEDHEWKVLWALVHEEPPRNADPPPTVAEAVKMIGRLGGHLGRKCDGMPGVNSLARGLRELESAANICRILGVLL